MGVLWAEFESAEQAARALVRLRACGVRRADTYGPHPLAREDADAPRGSFLLSFLAFAAGLLGLLLGYGIQWYVNVMRYPLDIGGRPIHAAPAFVPVTFEATVLCAAVAVFAGFLAAERLPRLWQPVFDIEGFERASIDRFWIAADLEGLDCGADWLEREIAAMHPLRVVVREEP